MRRRLLIIVCCLVAGAVINTIVAWSCALWSGSNTSAEVEMVEFDPDVHRWHAETVSVISGETIIFGVAESRSFGRSSRIAWTDPDFSLWRMGSRPGVVYDYTTISWSLGELQHVRTGWPCLAFEGGRGSPTTGGSSDPSFQYVNAIELQPDPDHPMLTKKFPRVVPLAPMWSGFIINTLFYAALIWCLSAGPFVVRRSLRRRRGRCLKCAYPIGEGEVCTECGKAISAGKPAR